jgi:hypothetical protein
MFIRLGVSNLLAAASEACELRAYYSYPNDRSPMTGLRRVAYDKRSARYHFVMALWFF